MVGRSRDGPSSTRGKRVGADRNVDVPVGRPQESGVRDLLLVSRDPVTVNPGMNSDSMSGASWDNEFHSGQPPDAVRWMGPQATCLG